MLACLAFAGEATGGSSGLMLAPFEPGVRSDISAEDRIRVLEVTRPAKQFDKPEAFEAMQGGAATSRKRANRDAFSQFSANIGFEGERDFKLGNALFRKLWVSAPSSTQASDGLGPLFNARACQSCHLKDGRGHPPEGAADATSMFLRLARGPRTGAEQAAIANLEALNFPDPVYGRQLQDLAVTGLAAEGQMAIRYEEMTVTLADGTMVPLRRPHYWISNPSQGPLDPDIVFSPRIAPPMIGLGLVQAIHPADIAALADPQDRDGDGISGRMQLVRDSKGDVTLGRFGWKAENPSVRAQTAGAFSGDIGISTKDKPDPHGECTQAQAACRAMPTGVQPALGDVEAPDPVLDLVTFYSENLAVPARRNVGAADVLEGKRLFHETGCAACHVPKFVTRRDASHPAHAFQLIWPHSDFLLHDMGDGLADGQIAGMADGREWRTAPLWGIGLTQTVSGHTFFLHDGRARNLAEAILWHGGEAQKARDAFALMPAGAREKLIRFLESL